MAMSSWVVVTVIGYVVRCINDKPMAGLTVAQVANHFRNVGQAKITLEIVESAVSPRSTAFTAAVTFGGVATLPNRPTTQTAGANGAQRPTTPVTGFSAVSSGRAIAAPGSALAVPTVAAPKQPVLRLGAKPAAKALGLRPESGPGSSVSAGMVTFADASMPSADAKTADDAKHTGLKSKAVAPILRLGLKSKPAQPEIAAEKVAATTTSVASKSIPTNPSSRIPQSPVQTIEAPRRTTSAQVSQAAQPKASPAPAVPVNVVTPVPTPLRSVPKAVAPNSTSSPSVAAGESVTVSPSLPVEAKSAITPRSSQPPSRPPSSAQESGARNSTSAPALIASNPTAAQINIAVPAPAVHPPEPATSSARRRTSPPPVVIPPIHNTSSTRDANSTQVQNTGSPANTAARSTHSPIVPTQAPTAPKTGKTGKKRGRPRKNPVASNGAASAKGKGKGKAKKAPKHQPEDAEVDAIMDDEDVFDYYAFTPDSDVEESPSTKSGPRTPKTRRRSNTDRTRHSLTVDRLVGMGFTQEDAEASVKEIGDDPDACMVWIISKIEERNFNEDLNRASIQSEQSKRDEEKRMKKREEETLAHTEKFMTLFPTSYMVCPESTASHLKKFLQSTIDQVNGDAYLRTILSKLLTLEGNSIRWYKEATRSYMLELAGRLDVALGAHDVMTCCARVSAIDVSSPNGSCSFVRKVLEEVNALTKALFEMSTNQGGVPPVFLACDKTTQFDLEDDGFEVVE